MHIDNSACNLASLNLMKFLQDDGSFDVDAFKHSIEVLFSAQEIIVGAATTRPRRSPRTRASSVSSVSATRTSGAPHGLGLAYDSDEGRAWAAAITALMTGHAYAVSARTAGRMGPHEGYEENAVPMLDVLRMHRDASYRIDEALARSRSRSGAALVEEAVDLGARHGVRNARPRCSRPLAPSVC